MSTLAGPQRWAVDTSDFLGFKYSTYKQKMYNYSITKPSEYTEMRMRALEKIKFQTVGNLYDELFNILSKGTTKSGDYLTTLTGTLEPPNYPQQEVTEIALEAAKEMQKIMEKVCDIVLPDYTTLASSQLKAKSDAAKIE
jgi:hypothetical protein